MSVRLSVFQRESRPLNGLCAQLQCAGYDVFERYTAEAVLELISHSDIDAVLLDADAEPIESLLAELDGSPDDSRLPTILIAETNSTSLGRIAAHDGIDDVMILPVIRDDLRSRVRNIARFTAMTAELERRLETLSDFGFSRHHRSEPETEGQSQVLLVGSIDDEQVPLIDALSGIATFAYAATTVQAWHRLRQDRVDAIIFTNTVPSGDIRNLCHQIRTRVSLRDLPVLISGHRQPSTKIEAICREMNVDQLRLAREPIVIQKRVQVMMRQYRLKGRLRGLMASRPYASTSDSLTGLFGRSFLYHYLDRTIQESREQSLPLSVVTCTTSGLAGVNATLGYPVGDKLVSQLGKALANSCRAQDLVARARGSSFCVVLNDTSESEARSVCERVTENLERSAHAFELSLFSEIDLEIGMAEMAPGDDAETLIVKALRHPATIALRMAS